MKYTGLFLIFALLTATSPLYANNGWQFGLEHRVSDLPPGILKSQLENLPEQAKSKALEKLQNLGITLSDVKYLRVSHSGGLYYADTFSPPETTTSLSSVEVAPTFNVDLSNVFTLESKPGSTNVFYLDFDGHLLSETWWNEGYGDYLAPPYDTDGNPDAFSSKELAQIAEIWRRVAEDFAPFDINITTRLPSSSFGPTVQRVLFTRSTAANGNKLASIAGVGVGHLDVWGDNYEGDFTTASDSDYTTAFVVLDYANDTPFDVVFFAITASHEIGHVLGLLHDGDSNSEYYRGAYTKEAISWSPIMGGGISLNVLQWNNGDYPDANQFQDDIGIIGNQLSFIPDDHPDSLVAESRLHADTLGVVSVTTPKNDPNNEITDNKGVINSSIDIDVFYFDASDGDLDLTVTPAHQDSVASDGGDLDVLLNLYDQFGNLIESDNVSNETIAQLSLPISSGRYYLSIEGTGSSNYSDYGSMGQYFISGTIPKSVDGCSSDTNTELSDTDGDGIDDVCDHDDDNDSHLDTTDNCPITPNIDQANLDGDSLGDACDADDDGDNVDDASDNCPVTANINQLDADNDGLGNACDVDDDNDGVLDLVPDNCPLDANPDQVNLDGDNLGDACDPDIDGDSVPDVTDNCPIDVNSNQADADGDYVGDACDLDDDNDGVNDAVDNCPVVSNADQNNEDGDNLGDACDLDLDGDGFENSADNCPANPNALQEDQDRDNVGDVCDADIDGDGFTNISDNCPVDINPAQDDLDANGIGDACDLDDDGDGINDDVDNCPVIANASQSDFDGDGLGDACEPDADNDNVLGTADICPETPLGEIVDPNSGCSLAQLAPCDAPMGSSEAWKNHGQYVSTVTRTSASFAKLGLITETEKADIVLSAVNSSCGSK